MELCEFEANLVYTAGYIIRPNFKIKIKAHSLSAQHSNTSL